MLDYTNHHSIADYNYRWCIFCHRKGVPGGNTFRRSLAMDYLDYNSDGTIRTVTQASIGVGAPTLPINRMQSLNFLTDTYGMPTSMPASTQASTPRGRRVAHRTRLGQRVHRLRLVRIRQFSGYYLRHSYFDFSLARNEGTAQYAADATFLRVPGLADESAVSFQSYNRLECYRRHYNFLLRLDPITDATDRAAATFRVTD